MKINDLKSWKKQLEIMKIFLNGPFYLILGIPISKCHPGVFWNFAHDQYIAWTFVVINMRNICSRLGMATDLYLLDQLSHVIAELVSILMDFLLQCKWVTFWILFLHFFTIFVLCYSLFHFAVQPTLFSDYLLPPRNAYAKCQDFVSTFIYSVFFMCLNVTCDYVSLVYFCLLYFSPWNKS